MQGPSKHTWQPIMTADTTTSSYWLNWRVLLCSIWILVSLVFASFLVSKYECPRKNSRKKSRETLEDSPGTLYQDEVWKPCLNTIHPAWLLGLRVVAFIVLLLMLILNIVVDGGDIMYYYTQWTFTLVTIYFGLGSLLSMYGCYQYQHRVGNRNEDVEPGSRFETSRVKNFGPNEEHGRQLASFWSYAFQIIFQMNAGAVLLTDCVFWFVIVPFLAIKDYSLNFLIINMHSINAVFLLAETALNSLRFPWFRIAYFFLWTNCYVIFQWIVHACIALWWPYPFLDLSSPYAPVWYSSVALLHIPCYGLFVLIMKLKHFLLSKWFPESYHSAR
ncbi:OLC1v1013161C3 [Oldenlandia corymbosa var. corymbosa]|uniref:OLC1v1013161C3 n=2 Tax=Oldenlandia corymbosa var. corymbosa TaxID=529605 RepID=A0AAV1E150_OLDCO|nr:OLC1v1013161C3 [Oldenlandia corymbosa var. corymbosa]